MVISPERRTEKIVDLDAGRAEAIRAGGVNGLRDRWRHVLEHVMDPVFAVEQIFRALRASRA